jgi:threonyl-tRNA synthetase
VDHHVLEHHPDLAIGLLDELLEGRTDPLAVGSSKIPGLDDRDERAGVKFKDADLIGVPYRITIGKKVAEGVVELFERQTKKSEDVKLSEIVSRVQSLALAGL